MGLKATVRPGGGVGVPYGEGDAVDRTGLVAERFSTGQTFQRFDLKMPLTPRSPKPGFLAVGGGLRLRCATNGWGPAKVERNADLAFEHERGEDEIPGRWKVLTVVYGPSQGITSRNTMG